MPDEPIDISEEWAEWFDSLSEERKHLIAIRVAREVEDLDDEDEVMEVFERITKTMMVQDTIAELQAEGIVEVSHVDDDGDLIFQATEKGRRYLNEKYNGD
jgi:hypothetical protein